MAKKTIEPRLAKRSADTVVRSFAVNTVYRSNDFDAFVEHPKNRHVKETRVKTFFKFLVETGKLVFARTIEVIRLKDGKLLVVDGHLRFQTLRKLFKEGYDVYVDYIIIKNEELSEQGVTPEEYLRVINNNQNDWPLRDKVNFYAKDDYNDTRRHAYQTLLAFEKDVCIKFDSPDQLRTACAILTLGECTPASLGGGRMQEYTVLERSYAKIRLRQISEVLNALSLNPRNARTEAIVKAFYGFRHDETANIAYETMGWDNFLSCLKTVNIADPSSGSVGNWINVFRMAVGLEAEE